MKYAKYTHILNLLASVPAPVFGSNPWENVAMTAEEAIDCFDHLFHYIHENFEDPRVLYPEGVYVNLSIGEIDIYYKECRELLQTKVLDFMERFERIPPAYSEIVFPVAVAMFLMRFKSIPLNHRKSKTFAEFADRYSRFILRGLD